MIINIFFSAGDIRKFFESNGFQVITSTFGRLENEYHNRSNWYEYNADAVIIDEKAAEASKLFRDVSEARLKQLIISSDEDMKQLIINEFKKISR